MKRAFLLITALILASCSSDEKIQSGPRYTLDGQPLSQSEAGAGAQGARLGGVSSGDWATHLGNNRHIQPNGALSQTPKLVGVANLGPMARRPVYGASAPIIVGERIYHYDAGGTLHAFSNSGKKIWSRSLIPNGEALGDGFGGGLAYQGGVVYAATGYGEVVAVNASSGRVKWRYSQSTPFRIAPLVAGGKVIVISGGTQAIALNASNGTVSWRRYAAQGTMLTRLNSGVPASSGDRAAVAYATGELALVSLASGRDLWEIKSISDAFTGSKAVLGDITADPVLSGNQIIIGTKSGILSVDAASGQQLWSNGIGSKGPLIVSGNSIIGISQDERLFRLSMNGGKTVWVTNLPKDKGDYGPFTQNIRHFDPRLVGGAILVADYRGNIRRFSAQTGKLTAITEYKAAFAATPVLGRGMMVGISQKGQLLVYR